jgi:hypothetical protein
LISLGNSARCEVIMARNRVPPDSSKAHSNLWKRLAASRLISSLAAQTPQRRELFGPFSAGQRRSLVERTDLLLQQRQ